MGGMGGRIWDGPSHFGMRGIFDAPRPTSLSPHRNPNLTNPTVPRSAPPCATPLRPAQAPGAERDAWAR